MTSRSVIRVGLFLLLLGVPVVVSAQDTGDVDHRLLPERETLFRQPLADPRALTSHVSAVQVTPESEELDDFLGAFVGITTDYPLYRGTRLSTVESWQVDVEAGVLSQFDMDQESDDLLNTDFFVGFPFTYRKYPYSVRVRLMHQSSHLGDELLLRPDAPERINLSLEFVDVLLAYEYEDWRIYGGGSDAFRHSPSTLDARTLQAGLEYFEEKNAERTGIIAGVDYRSSAQTNWDPGVSLRAGMRFGDVGAGSTRMDVRLEYYTGPLPYGQFFTEDVKYAGLGVYLDT